MVALERLDSDDTVTSIVAAQGSARTLHTFHFDRFAANENNFRPRNGHRIVEIRQPVNGSDACLEEHEIIESKLSNWFQSVAQMRDEGPPLPSTGSATQDMEYRLRLL